MNLTNVCPDIPDNWKGSITDTCRILGGDKPLSDNTLRKYAKLGKQQGGIDWRPSKTGKMIFSGREVKRFWNEFA